MMANTTDGNVAFRSTYHILKPAKELVKEYKIHNTEYDKPPDEMSSSATSTSNQHLTSSSRSVSLSAN